jgi:formylglycine-generating enzyme required for sulfatase activity
MTRPKLAVSVSELFGEPQPAHAATILLEPQPAHAPTILLDHAKPGVDPAASVATRLKEKDSTLLGRFKLLEVIGEGGMSLVYKAIDLRKVEAGSVDPHIAVKVLTVPFANYSDAMAVLSREAHNLQSLMHPNIVRVIDCDRDGDIVFMTMELLSGKSLFDRMRTAKAGLPREFALRLIESIANALDFAHGKNILHGDLKPGNVFITDGGEIKVIDFGLARLMVQPKGVQPKAANNAADRLRALTPAYASPEMLEAEEPDPRDDVFSLACVAWKIMTGEHPFKGKDPTAARKAGTKLVRPSQLTRREFRALCHGLEFKREKRTPSALQFFAEFGAARAGRSWPIAAGVAAIAVVIAAAAFFALKPVRETVSPAAVAPLVETAPAAPTQGVLFRDCPTCPLMKVLPPGEFLQGSAPNDTAALPFEMPQHKVSISYAFAAGVYDVTVGEFSEFVAETKVEARGCATYDGEWRVNPAIAWKNAVESQTASHPVSCVSWQDAKDYAAWLSHRTHQTYRLPSASEWEYAARAGSAVQQPWSDPAGACAYANVADQTAAQRYLGWSVFPCADKFVQSAPVGSFAANAFGLYDTLGNVFQWTEDCWSEDYQGAPVDGSASMDGDCTQHELRGGSWFTHPDYVRTSYRNRFASDYRSTSVGFRLIRETGT